MKRVKISLFDVALLLLVVLAGGVAYWQLHHSTVEQPQSAETLLSDLHRSAERYTDQSAMEETEEFVIDYILKIPYEDEETAKSLLHVGDSMYSSYNNAPLGELKSVSYSEKDGKTWAKLTINLYVKFYKTRIVSIPTGDLIKTGRELALCREDGTYLGNGAVIWIKH